MNHDKRAEAVIVKFFMSAPPDAAFTLLVVAQSLVSARGITAADAPATLKRPRRKGLDLRTHNDVVRSAAPAAPEA